METNGDVEDGDETEENDGVDENRGAASLHIPEFDDTTSRRNLKEQSRCQKHEQYHCDHHRSPIRHYFDARERVREIAEKRSVSDTEREREEESLREVFF